MKKQNYLHIPVLKEEVLETFSFLANLKQPVFVDGTLGLGGHSIAIVSKLKEKNSKSRVIGIDKDQCALDIAREKISCAGLINKFTLVHDDFRNIKGVLSGQSIEKVDGILLDLGVSSMQIDNKERGFSYLEPEQALDMRMDQSQELDAYYVVNKYSEHDLAAVLRDGEEKFYKSIARNIVKRRRERPVATVGDLLEIVKNSISSKIIAKNAKSFAADTFRAIRFEVNDELSGLREALMDCVDVLNPGGRLAVITFHSLEDRIAKTVFRELENPCTCPKEIPYCVCEKKPSLKIITKKPTSPAGSELEINPRAKSSKLRVIEKI